MNYAIAKISTKGQIVIPKTMRKDIDAGDEFLVVKDNDRLMLKKMNSLAEDVKEDLEFAKIVEKAWQEYEKGKFKTSSKKDFLKELDEC